MVVNDWTTLAGEEGDWRGNQTVQQACHLQSATCAKVWVARPRLFSANRGIGWVSGKGSEWVHLIWNVLIF